MPAGSYTVSAGDNETRVEIYDYSSGIKIIDTTGGTIKFTLNNETDISWKASLNGGKKNNMKIMLNSGTTALPWEPYTGGKPSPNPDYPQELVSAGDKGSVETRVTGKNLFDVENCLNCEIVTFNGKRCLRYIDNVDNMKLYINNKKQQQYTLTFRTFRDSGSSDKDVRLKFHYTDGTDSDISGTPNEIATATSKPGKIVEYISGFNAWGENVYMDLDVTQLEIGSTATAYEPYTLQSFPHATPNGFHAIPVTSGGNYTDASGQQWIADYRDWERGVDVQMVAEYVFDGSEDEPWVELGGANNSGRCVTIKVKKGSKQYSTPLLCNYSITKVWSTSDATCFINEYSEFYFGIEKAGFASLEEFKTKLAETPMQLQYVLASPIETPIPPEELAAYHAAHTNYPNTVLTNDEGCWMEVEYARKHEEVMEEKVQEGSIMTDVTTGKNYILGVKDGLLTMFEVIE